MNDSDSTSQPRRSAPQPSQNASQHRRDAPVSTRPTLPLRELVLFGGLAVIVLGVFSMMGPAYATRMLVEASCYAILALGLTIQWGYAGQFNAGIMGFVALGGFSATFFSIPVNHAFWQSDLPARLGWVLLAIIAVIAIVFAISRLDRIGVPKLLRTVLAIVAGLIGYLVVVSWLRSVTGDIESQVEFIGGLGLPVWLGWIVGGALAGGIGYVIGHICLGLRSDYLVIATLGIAEIIKAFLKNSDWLTRGTATISPLPWPVPTPGDVGFLSARAFYLAVTVVMIAVIFFLLHRAYHAPWGRMIRAIRDNEVSAAAMGKSINRRRQEIFVFGCILMGVGGAALTSFNGIFDPQGYLPLNHTFLVLVMVILGGPGNNLGTLFGAVLVYVIWIMSGPLALALMHLVTALGGDWFGWQPGNLDSRALQARVFVIGLLILMVLRFAPRGLMPEKVAQHD